MGKYKTLSEASAAIAVLETKAARVEVERQVILKRLAEGISALPGPASVPGVHFVTSYGAKGDGVTDDTAAIQAALNAADPGDQVYVPAGTGAYMIDAITVPAGVELTGPGTIKAKAQLGATNIVVLSAGARLTRLTLDGNAASQPIASVNMVRLAAGASAQILDCLIQNVRGYGVVATDAVTDIRVSANQLTNLTDVRAAVSFQQTSGTTERVVIADNVINSVGAQAVMFVNASGIGFHDITVSGNIVRNAVGIPIEIQRAERAAVVGNVVSGSGTNGISVGSCSYLTVSDNVVRDQSNEGIELGTGSFQAVTGNVITDCAIGIIAADTASDVTIAGNTILRCTGSSNGDAIRVIHAGARWTIVGNTIRDTVNGAAITLAGGVADVLVANNNIVQTAAGATTKVAQLQIAGCSRVLVASNRISMGVDQPTFTYIGTIHLSGTTEDVEVRDNVVVSTAGVLTQNGIQTVATGSRIRITGNYVYGFARGITNNGPGGGGQVTDRIERNVVENCTILHDIMAGTYLTRTRVEYEAAAAPTAGTWRQGDIVWNTGAAAGGKAGWYCVSPGTPGTWRAFGVIDP